MKKSEQLLQDLSDLGIIDSKKLKTVTSQKAISLIRLYGLSVHESAVEDTVVKPQ